MLRPDLHRVRHSSPSAAMRDRQHSGQRAAAVEAAATPVGFTTRRSQHREKTARRARSAHDWLPPRLGDIREAQQGGKTGWDAPAAITRTCTAGAYRLSWRQYIHARYFPSKRFLMPLPPFRTLLDGLAPQLYQSAQAGTGRRDLTIHDQYVQGDHRRRRQNRVQASTGERTSTRGLT